MAESTSMRGRVSLPLLALALLLSASQAACVLPARVVPGVSGVVVDADSGDAIEGAIVVVRFDGRYGEVLPDRELIGHRESASNSNGIFDVGSIVQAGLASWPSYKTSARVVSVIKEGYRCPDPIAVHPKQELKIELRPALDLADQRDSCRPVPAKRDEADAYMTAWRELFPSQKSAEDIRNARQLSRILEARAALGHGDNCHGPVSDLALSSDGVYAGLSIAPSPNEIRVIDFSAAGNAEPMLVAHDEYSPPRRLAWTRTGDLVLWEPAGDAQSSVSPSAFGGDHFEAVFRGMQRNSMLAKIDYGPKRILKESRPRHTPLDPADLNDEADTRWLGRAFEIQRELDPATGLSLDRLEVSLQSGTRYEFELPGEACGASGRFGRPQYRILEGGEVAIDLRYVDGGCHAVSIDLTSGTWRTIDGSQGSSVCVRTRNIPASHITTALRSYTREVQAARVTAGGDPAASYALLIAGDGTTRVETRSHTGEAVNANVPNFPINTPLQRINVSLIGGVYKAPKAPSPVPGTAPLDLNPL